MKLTIELVPRGAWFNNLRSSISPSRWDEVRRKTYRRVGYTCEVCGGKGPTHPVECHEKWDYDDENHVAVLSGLMGLCPLCHEVKHIGLAGLRGRGVNATAHLCRVNGISLAEAEKVISEAFEVWRRRSQHEWKVDISWLFRDAAA